MNYSEKIIEKFGGIQPLRRALGHKNHTTVLYWKQSGTIPQKHWSDLLVLAKEQGVHLDWSDFFESDEESDDS
jgi:hypothetical protein